MRKSDKYYCDQLKFTIKHKLMTRIYYTRDNIHKYDALPSV